MIQRVLIAIALAGLFTVSPSNAAGDPFEGIEQAELQINGETYLVPVVPEEGKGFAMSMNDAYLLKKAIKGDQDARDLLLQGHETRSFFIGRREHNAIHL